MVMKVALLSALSAASAEDFVQHPRGYKRSRVAENEIFDVAELTPEDIAAAPDAIDWSARGATSAINDQGDCGSCWAFSTMQGVESGVFMAEGKLPEPLSVQELVSCEKDDDGCDGGDIPEAVKYLKKNGMSSAANYPDTSSKSGRTGNCKWNKEAVVSVTGMKYAIPTCSSGDCSTQDEEALAAALAKYGPISVCINSGDGQTGDWMKYKGGVLSGSCKAKARLIDHCVQLVGYDKTAAEPYWKVRNSWGKSWGDDGFIRLPYGNQNSCCIGCEAVIISATSMGPSPAPTPPAPTPTPTPTPPAPTPTPTPTPSPTPSEWCPHPDCPKGCQTRAESNCALEEFSSYDDCMSCMKKTDATYIWCDPKYRRAFCNQIGGVVV